MERLETDPGKRQKIIETIKRQAKNNLLLAGAANADRKATDDTKVALRFDNIGNSNEYNQSVPRFMQNKIGFKARAEKGLSQSLVDVSFKQLQQQTGTLTQQTPT